MTNRTMIVALRRDVPRLRNKYKDNENIIVVAIGSEVTGYRVDTIITSPDCIVDTHAHPYNFVNSWIKHLQCRLTRGGQLIDLADLFENFT